MTRHGTIGLLSDQTRHIHRGVGSFGVTIVRPAPEHRDSWDRLFADYARFYETHQTAEMRDRVWAWIHDPGHEVECLLAIDENRHVTGFAHFRSTPQPLSATMSGFLEDLFVEPQERGRGYARALIGAVVEQGRTRGWSVVQWMTKDDNYRARAVYDRVAVRTDWVTYEVGC